jgi:hypothetical protein
MVGWMPRTFGSHTATSAPAAIASGAAPDHHRSCTIAPMISA